MRSSCGRMLVTTVAILAAACRAATAAEPTLAEEAAFRAAVGRVAAAVVRIESLAVAATAAAEPAAPSTGLVVDPAGLVLATAFAVPAASREAVVVLADGRRLAATPLGRDVPRGIVLLKTDPLPAVPAIEAVPRDSLEAGQWTIAVGRGWSAAEPSMAVGILSAVDRGWGLAVQTDAAVSPMNYGGPLIDIAGRVIGVVAPLPAESAKLMGGTELYDGGIGFAVPLEDILARLPRMAAGESLAGGLLGVGYRSRDTINGDPVVASVRQGSPAARAGLRPGDRIVAIDGRPVRRIADARHAVTPRHAGDVIAVEVDRGRGESPTRLTVSPTLAASLPPWRRAILGIVVAGEAGREDDEAARIDWVLPGGPADAAGITAGGMVASITAVDGVPAGEPAVEHPSAAAVAGVLAGLEPGRRVRVGIRRGPDVSSVEVALGELPREVPAEAPPAPAEAIAGGDDVQVVRLVAADAAVPPLAVVPAGRRPVPVLIWCGLPPGPDDDDAGAVDWKAAAATTGVAVILPGSRDRREWSEDDVRDAVRSLESLHARRPVDGTRIGVAGRGVGGAFAWLVADRMAAACRGVAVLDAPLPPRIVIDEAEPGGARWLLLGGHGDEAFARRLEEDRARLIRAGHAVGTLPDSAAGRPPAATLCRWAALLGLL